MVLRVWGLEAFDVHGYFARRALRRRMIALAAAYALALGALFASWAVSNTAALSAAGLAAVICHNDGAGEPAPGQNHDSDTVCVDSCCVGCVLLMATLPPPPVKAIGVPQSAARPLPPTPARAVSAGSSTRSHQSRAPPQTA
jgi:hypothetical protein